MYRIVIDTFGADAGIKPVIYGVAKALKKGISFFPILVGEPETISALMDSAGIKVNQYEVVKAEKYISQNEAPTVIFTDSDSSMAIAYDRLKNDDTCLGMISPGNTGALLVGSICRLGLLGGLKSPALASALPCAGEKLVCLVDCGANVECTAADLARFATMGNIFSKSILGLNSPRVGLMSVGRESHKGNELTREAYALIEKLPLNFVGNLEGSDLSSGYADVIVTDGFSGNILLKNAEAIGKKALEIVTELGVGADPEILKRIKTKLFETFDFNSRGAATFLGTKKAVLKMHGSANEDTMVASIEQLIRIESAGFSSAMKSALQ